ALRCGSRAAPLSAPQPLLILLWRAPLIDAATGRSRYYNLMRLLLALLFCLPLPAQVPAEDSRNTSTPGTDTHFTPRVYRTRGEWEARRAYLRKQILSASGLLPLPVKRDLRAQIFGRIENRDRDYSIEKVLLETL